MPSEHLLQILIQALLALAVFSFLEYSIRTVHAPQVVNRRAKVLCAVGLILGVLGIWVLMFHRVAGLALALFGNLLAVATMIWLERHARGRKPVIHPPQPKPDESQPGQPGAPQNPEATPESAADSPQEPPTAPGPEPQEGI